MMKISMAAILIRCITIMENAESVADEITSKATKCFPTGNHSRLYKWYDKTMERSEENVRDAETNNNWA